jgi:hypothetical protein
MSDPSPSIHEEQQYQEQKRLFFASLSAERNRFIDAKADQSKTYDQTILTFSAGAIGLSLTFLEKLAPHPAHTWLLYASWILFGTAILSVIVSFALSQAAIDYEIAWIDATWAAVESKQTQPPPRLANSRQVWTKAVNIASGGFFVLGIATLVAFAAANWPPPAQNPSRIGTSKRIDIRATKSTANR